MLDSIHYTYKHTDLAKASTFFLQSERLPALYIQYSADQ